MRHGCRAWLLRRTLLARPDYAAYVKVLKLPEYDPDLSTGKELGEMERIVASLVVLCPHLEKLVGYYPEYRAGAKDGIQAALLSRDFLKEHVWTIGSDGPMQLTQSEAFVNCHIRWTKLETLVLHGRAGQKGGSMSPLTFAGLFESLPALRKLLISRFHDYEFDDNTLLAIPDQVERLRLEELPGVTDSGISRYVEQPGPARRLRVLALMDLEILSLLVISKLFARLTNLEKFTLLQTACPQLPVEATAKPHLTSKSLQLLHWDVLIPGPGNAILARSIHSSGFPSLKAIRAPSDHHGVLQAVCKPLEQIVLPFDKIEARILRAQKKMRENEYYYPETRYSRSLPQARLNAQERIEAARKSTFMRILVTEGVMQKASLSVDLKAFMGDWKSRVNYELLPDLWGSEYAVLGLSSLLAGRIIAEWKQPEGAEMCVGKWNSDSKMPPRWWAHTERTPGMRDMALSILF